MTERKPITHKHLSIDSEGHGNEGIVMVNDNHIAVHGRSASKMSVAETNKRFAELAKKQKATRQC